jgi:hypothetical protein
VATSAPVIGTGHDRRLERIRQKSVRFLRSSSL